MTPMPRGHLVAVAALCCMGLMGGGCFGPVELVEVVTWEADLLPAAGVEEDITGNVAMVANEFTTQIGIGLSGEADGRYTWAVHEGSCAAPGSRVGPADAFPPLELGDDGNGSASMLLNRRVDPDPAYVAVVRVGTDVSGLPKACGTLVRGD